MIFLSLLSGFFIGTSYIPFPPWAIFFGFVPLLFVWQSSKTLTQVFWSGWICQTALTLIGFNWVAHTIHEFGKMPFWAALIGLFLFASFANLYIPLSGIAWKFFCRKLQLNAKASVPIALASLALGESVYPMIFDWNFGYTWLWQKWPAMQTAEWIGFHGLSHFSILSNLAFFYVVQDLFCKRNFKLKPSTRWIFAGWIGLFISLNGAGTWLEKRVTDPEAEAQFLITQANIGNAEKHLAKYQYGFMSKILDRYLELTKSRLETLDSNEKKPDFILWPETAYQDTLTLDFPKKVLQTRLEQEVRELGIGLITGGYGLRNLRQPTNSLFFINQNGQPLRAQYDKTMLLAFGEYLPGAIWWPKLKTLLPMVADFARGYGPMTVDFNGKKLGPQICYEGLFGWFTRDLANQGAEIIVNVTNDSWYGTWQEPYQHLFMTLARAIEIRRPLVRATNTGISTAILANGQILAQSPLHEEWADILKIPYTRAAPRTLFMGWGYWISYLILLLWIFGFLFRSRMKRTSN